MLRLEHGSGTHIEDRAAIVTSGTPTVTVIIQTFNRSNILPHAIGSVLWQTYGDWELLVIGDGCTDDSAAVVARFTNPRIRFINRAERVGGQSGPNDEGARTARSRAHLNASVPVASSLRLPHRVPMCSWRWSI
jgi:Glycosyl transferase family 2